jgi:hypothetical protein
MFASSGLSKQSTWRHNPEDSNLQTGPCCRYTVDGEMAANPTVTVFEF